MASKKTKKIVKHNHAHSKELAIGGQAVIEGVMMRTKDDYVVAVRAPSGKIIVSKQKFVSYTKKNKILGLPFVRGIVMLYETTLLGIKALNFSAEIDLAEEEKQTKKHVPSKKISKTEKKKEEFWLKAGITTTFVISAVFAIGLFKFLPLLSASMFQKTFGASNLLFNVIDGLTKLSILLLYLFLIGLMPDVKRLFQYHGAEHMAVACHEKGLPLTVDNVKKCKKEHPRCGTSFIIFVLTLSILFYMVIPMNTGFWEKLGFRLLLLPIIAGFSYELIRIAGKYDNWATHILAYPGVIVQKITTKKPDKGQIEIAIKSLTEVLK